MKALVLGRTIFLGRHLIEAALAHGHEVTIFNRRRHNSDLYPEIEKLRGDPNQALAALHGRRWDAVIDTCSYVPSAVRKSAGLLAGTMGIRYQHRSPGGRTPDILSGAERPHLSQV